MNQKGFVNIIIIVIVVVLVGAGAYLVLNRQTQPTPTPKEVADRNGQSGTITVQPEDSNKIGFAPYSDYPLGSIPSTPISVKYLVEHRSALDGKTITVRGVIVGILSTEAACPPDRGACGAPMIFLADSAKTDRDKYLDLGIRVSEEEKGYIIGENVEVKVVVSGSKTAVYLAKVY